MLVLAPCGEKFHVERPVLSADMAKVQLAAYVAAQTIGKSSRAVRLKAKQRRNILSKAEKAIAGAETERDGLLWLLDAGINIENVIFYSHTGRFCFGWRTPLSPAVESELLDLLCEFLFDYDLKT